MKIKAYSWLFFIPKDKQWGFCSYSKVKSKIYQFLLTSLCSRASWSLNKFWKYWYFIILLYSVILTLYDNSSLYVSQINLFEDILQIDNFLVPNSSVHLCLKGTLDKNKWWDGTRSAYSRLKMCAIFLLFALINYW